VDVAALLQAGATVVGSFLPVIAVVFHLAVSVLFIVEPLRRIRIRARRAPSQKKPCPTQAARAC
jgi:hypothetical protein